MKFTWSEVPPDQLQLSRTSFFNADIPTFLKHEVHTYIHTHQELATSDFIFACGWWREDNKLPLLSAFSTVALAGNETNESSCTTNFLYHCSMIQTHHLCGSPLAVPQKCMAEKFIYQPYFLLQLLVNTIVSLMVHQAVKSQFSQEYTEEHADEAKSRKMSSKHTTWHTIVRNDWK